MKLVVSTSFDRDLKKLLKKNNLLQAKVHKSLVFLQQNLNHPSLRLHKLEGQNNFSISVDMSLRIIIHIQDEFIFLLKIGSHDEVY